MNRLALVIATLALAIPAGMSSPAQAAEVEIEADGPVIELSNSEAAKVEPDYVVVTAEVSTTAQTASEAQMETAKKAQNVLARIQALGISSADVVTEEVSLDPDYDYDEQGNANRKRYEVTNSFMVTVSEVERISEIFDALIDAGATDISSPRLGLKSSEKVQAVLRQRAAERAFARAKDYARLSGFDSVRLLLIEEGEKRRQGFVLNGEVRVENVLGSLPQVSPSQPTPISLGKVGVRVQINFTFELVDEDTAPEAAD
ncbi:MAG: SIMPL domain-containing protein [Pseudomonadota bacterium]